MRPFSNAILLLALTAIAGCSIWSGSAPAPTVRPSVTETYEGNQIDQANQQAEEYCKARGLKAMLRITSVKDGTQYATYECTVTAKPVAP